MGVPAFFRWLTRKYASVVVDCVENQPVEIDGETIYANSSEPNPNNVEFDNLYLDMNGIIHPCTHPENKPAPKNEDEMMVAIFECIDRLFRIVRPRKVLYMAIDGVAPRAKMNQQRSRRFRASKETSEKIEEIARIREDLLARGVQLPPEKPKGDHFDSNCITPGTPFMARLSVCLHYYIHDRLNNDPGWKGIKVILSDANVPGEGEHKIMDYIRKQRAQPDHDPNTQHCLCGADADLIMLGLATHEPNFTIIREEFKPNQPRPCEICGQIGHELKDCVGVARQEEDSEAFIGSDVNFIFVRLCVLREYLEKELNMPNLPFPFNLERAIDDWVFMCFFVGNDFLPHLPSLEIREGAIDRLVTLYKEAVYKTGGYLTDSGDVNLDRVQLIMSQLGEAEDSIFKKRQETEKFFREKNKRNKKREKMMKDFGRPARGQFAPQPLGRGMTVQPVKNARQEAYEMRMQSSQSERQAQGLEQTAALKAMLRIEGSTTATSEPAEDSDEEPEPADEVRLWEDGFKDRYYSSKFDSKPNNVAFRHLLALEYVRGLCWVLKYYYQGCASWKWYFPYHYAPFASDFVNIASLSTDFEMGTVPFRPLEQLMGVFPAASSDHVPQPWGELMRSPDSIIIDFYPIDFKVDLNGKKFAWQGVALLPFVEEERLFAALKPYYKMLTPAEMRRNVRGDDRLYVGKHHSEFNFLNTLYETCTNMEQEFERSIEGVRGRILLAEDRVPPEGTIDSPVNGLEPLLDNRAVCVRFRDPKYEETFKFPAVRLPGAVDPPRVLRPGDFERSQRGGRGGYGGGGGGGYRGGGGGGYRGGGGGGYRGGGGGYRGGGGGYRGGGGGGGADNWRPQIGMAPARQRATINDAGHRMLDHGINSRNQQQHYGQQHNPSGHGGQYGAASAALSHIPPTLAALPPQQMSHGGGKGRGGGWDNGQRSQQQPWRTDSNQGGGGYSSYGGHNPSSRGGAGGAGAGGRRDNAGRGGQQDQRYRPYSNESRQSHRGGRDNRGGGRGGQERRY